MEISRYAVVLEGYARDGFDPARVSENLARLFKIDPQRMRVLMQKGSRVIKSGLDREAALRYQEKIEQAGAACRVVEEPAASMSPPTLETKVQAHPASPCPKCGGDLQPPGEGSPPTSCPFCGIVIEKFLRNRQRDRETLSESTRNDPQPTEGAGAPYPGVAASPSPDAGQQSFPSPSLARWGLIGGIALLLAVGGAVFWTRSPTQAPAPPTIAPNAARAPAPGPTSPPSVAISPAPAIEFSQACLTSLSGIVFQHFYTQSMLPGEIGPFFASQRTALPALQASAIDQFLRGGRLFYRTRGSEAFDLALRLDDARWLLCKGEPLSQSWEMTPIRSDSALPPW